MKAAKYKTTGLAKNTYTKTDIEDSYMNIEKYIFKRKYERNNDILRINNR